MLCVMLCCVVCGSACGVCGVVLLVLLVVVVCVWCMFGFGVSPVELSLAPEIRQRNRWILPISSLRIGRTRHVPDSFNHSLHLMRTVQSPDGSICLSPQEAECNERFARQYRYGPPLEILLTLPFSRCVHNLSVLTLVPTFKITENTHTRCFHEPSKTQQHFVKKMYDCSVFICAVPVLWVWPRVRTSHSTQHRDPRYTKKIESLKIINSRDEKIDSNSTN